jgi:hypothetical protein
MQTIAFAHMRMQPLLLLMRAVLLLLLLLPFRVLAIVASDVAETSANVSVSVLQSVPHMRDASSAQLCVEASSGT